MAGTAASAAELRPLPWSVPVAAAGFGLVLLALLVADVAPAARLALLAAFAMAALAMARELRRQARGRVLAWDGRGGWMLDGEAVAVAPSTRVHPGLVVLVLRQVPRSGGPPGRGSAYWVARGASAPDSFRRLKQQLRHGRGLPSAERPENTPC